MMPHVTLLLVSRVQNIYAITPIDSFYRVSILKGEHCTLQSDRNRIPAKCAIVCNVVYAYRVKTHVNNRFCVKQMNRRRSMDNSVQVFKGPFSENTLHDKNISEHKNIKLSLS